MPNSEVVAFSRVLQMKWSESDPTKKKVVTSNHRKLEKRKKITVPVQRQHAPDK